MGAKGLRKGEPMEIIIKCSDSCRGNTKLDGTMIEEIVRCGECKYRDSEFCQIRESMYGIKDNDFCSYGERRSDGNKRRSV